MFLTGALAVQVRQTTGAGPALIGTAMSLFFGVAALSAPVMGRLIDRHGWRPGLVWSGAATLASLLGVAALGASPAGLTLSLGAGGIGAAAAIPASGLLFLREAPAHRRALMFGLNQAAVPVAGLLSGMAVPLLGLSLGWRWAFLSATVVPLLLVATTARRPAGPGAPKPAGSAAAKPGPRRVAPRATDPGPGRAAPAAGRASRARRALLSRGVFVLVAGVSAGAVANALPTFHVQSVVEAGISPARAGGLLAVGSLGCLITRVAAGWWVDAARLRGFGVAALLLAAGGLGFLLLGGGSPAALVAGTLLAFGPGWGWPGAFQFGVVTTSTRSPATAAGLAQAGTAAGGALGPLLFGFVAEWWSFREVWLIGAVVAAVAAAAMLTLCGLSGRPGPSPGPRERSAGEAPA